MREDTSKSRGSWRFCYNLENVRMAEIIDEFALEELQKNTLLQKRQSKSKITNKHVLKKRQPICFAKRKTDIYVTTKTTFKAQLNRCEKLLDSGKAELVIHGLGAAINRACNLALQLKKNHFGTLELDINTSTVDLLDDLQPLDDDGDYEVNNRQNSAIHIRVFRTTPIGTLKYAK